jgi:hypothetical protein
MKALSKQDWLAIAEYIRNSDPNIRGIWDHVWDG